MLEFTVCCDFVMYLVIEESGEICSQHNASGGPGMAGDENYLKKELYDLMRADDALFEFLQEGALDGIWYWDLEEQEQEWMSSRFWTLLGYDPAEMRHLSSEWQDIIFQEDLPAVIANFEKHCADPDHPYDQIVRYRHKNGSTVWVRCRGVAIRDEGGRPIRMLGAHTDLTALKKAEEEVRRLSVTDSLTLAYNRRFFIGRAEEEISRAIRYETPLSLCTLDIDFFKNINDSFGHEAGDEVLKALVETCQNTFRESDTFARMGGEEFGALLPNTILDQASLVAERVRLNLEELSISYHQHDIKFTVSIGVSQLTEEDHSVAPLMRRADKALYQAKEQGRNLVVTG